MCRLRKHFTLPPTNSGLAGPLIRSPQIQAGVIDSLRFNESFERILRRSIFSVSNGESRHSLNTMKSTPVIALKCRRPYQRWQGGSAHSAAHSPFSSTECLTQKITFPSCPVGRFAIESKLLSGSWSFIPTADTRQVSSRTSF
jgi:hypothetical protein